MNRRTWAVSGLCEWGGLLCALLALAVLPHSADAAPWRERSVTLADSGTAGPSDSETDAQQREDEPAPGDDEPAGRGGEPVAPSEGDDFGCPVRDQGPFPMLV